MEVEILEEKNKIDEFVKAQDTKSGSFLQSHEWGEFQKHYGYKIWHLGIFDQEKLKAVALMIKYPLPLGKSYLYCPKGPVIEAGSRKRETKGEILKSLFEQVKEIAKKEKVIFFKFEPPVSEKEFNDIKIDLKLKAAKSIQPENNWLLELRGTEEEILARMKQKTRYNIRLAQKKGVKIEINNSPENINQFFTLVQGTAQRNKIRAHPKKYYYQVIESLAQFQMVKLYQAKYDHKIIAVNLILSFGDTATYLHGGSSQEYRNVMAPYLLHWQAISDAKKEGKRYYDFGGVAPENALNHKWEGISRFKRSFGGYQLESAGAFDLVFNLGWYSVYQIAKMIKRGR